jgi:molybdate transport system regulatory protein
LASSKKVKLQPVFRLALEGEKQTVLDQTDARLLRYIGETNSLSKAAKKVGISYRNAWDRMKQVERTSGKRIVETKVGGAEGGRATLTPEGAALFQEFRRVRKYLFDALDDRESWGQASYKLSARNRIRARVTSVQKGSITSQVKMISLEQAALTSIISNEAVEDLDIKEGDEVEAIVKSTEVIVGKEVRVSRRGRKIEGRP